MVLIGGGTVATRNARLLLRAGANLTVVSPELDGELEALLADLGGIWQQSRYQESDLHGKTLAVAATPDSPSPVRSRFQTSCGLAGKLAGTFGLMPSRRGPRQSGQG